MSVKQHEAFCLDSAQDRFWWIDHFLGDQLKDEWRPSGTGSGAVIDGQDGGVYRLTTGAVVNNSRLIDWNDKRILVVSKKVCFEAKIKLTSISDLNIHIGIWNGWNDYIIFHFDTTYHSTFRIAAVEGGSGTNEDSEVSPDTSHHIFRIKCHTHGGNHVHFFIDDVECTNSPISANVSSIYLQPRFFIQTRTTVAKSMDIDYVAVRQDR